MWKRVCFNYKYRLRFLDRPLHHQIGHLIKLISNNIIKARIYFPDAKHGYYRGMGFDWASVISELKYKCHFYLGKWLLNYRPKLHDAIKGSIDVFSFAGISGFHKADR